MDHSTRLKLINFIKARKSMYDKQHPSYRNKQLNDENYEQFAIENPQFVGVARDVKKVWTSLRNSFTNK